MEDLMTYLQFGKHGPYVWGAWIACLLLLGGSWITTNLAAKRAKDDLELIRPKRPKKKEDDA